MTVDAIGYEMAMSSASADSSSLLPPSAVHTRRLLKLAHWPESASTGSIAWGCLGIFAGFTTRAVWTTVFLIMFGMRTKAALGIAAAFYTTVGSMAVFYHVRLFSKPHILHRLLSELDHSGECLRRMEAGAAQGVFTGFLAWALSWMLSWWLVFASTAMELPSSKLRTVIIALLPIDLCFGRALEHKAQFFTLYIKEMHEMLAQSVREFATSVEEVVGSEDITGPGEVYEKLHQAECKMRTHMKWVSDMEGSALLAYMSQEALSAIYTAAVAFYTTRPMLEIGLLAYSFVQLVMLLRTGLAIASPGDEYHRACLNLDTPRMIYNLQVKLQVLDRGGCALDYLHHLYRAPAGIRIWATLVRLPLVVQICVTVAAPTIAVLFQSLTAYMDME